MLNIKQYSLAITNACTAPHTSAPDKPTKFQTHLSVASPVRSIGIINPMFYIPIFALHSQFPSFQLNDKIDFNFQ